jgi:uncharacterized damage-inducible protein DinB
MSQDTAFRVQIRDLLDWHHAHADFETVVKDLPAKLRAVVPERLPYSPWQLLEHIRLAQHDILEFCRNPHYTELKWPDDYWPASAAPPSPKAWDKSVADFLADRAALKQLATDPAVDLFTPIPHGNGQTVLRELLLVADHTSYHLGELVVVRRALGAWK